MPAKRRAVVASLLCTLTLSAAAPFAAAAAAGIALATDLRGDARAVGDDGVLVLMISRSDCGYCRVLKREVLDPTVKSGDYAGRAAFRELMIDDPAPIRDFDGAMTTAAAVARRYRETLSPTLLFVDSDGNELTTRRHGVSTIDFYGHYLDRAIRRAEAAQNAKRR